MGAVTLDVSVSRQQHDEHGQVSAGCVNGWIASIDGLMRGAGWWSDDLSLVAGLSGITFQFVVHPTWCASSTNAYDWVTDNTAAARRLGLQSEAVDHWVADGFKDAQARALAAIKRSIDRGVAAILWLPSPRTMGFGLATGYDDEEEILFVDDEDQVDCDPVRYANLGCTHGLEWLHYQVITSRSPIDLRTAAQESLNQALLEWRRGAHAFQSTPFAEVFAYPAGEAGYDALIDGLRNGLLGRGEVDNRRGIDFILPGWADGRRLASAYLRRLDDDGIVSGVRPAAECYREVSAGLHDAHRHLEPEAFNPDRAIEILNACRAQEEQAARIIERALAAAPA